MIMASVVQALKNWKEAVVLHDQGHFDRALSALDSIPKEPMPGIPRARLLFNQGCLHLCMRDHEKAIQKFSQSVEKDAHMSISFFLRASIHFINEQYESSLKDFVESHAKLRGLPWIDYTQLGLCYKLCASEALYNAALSAARLKNVVRTVELLLQAQTLAEDQVKVKVQRAIESVNEGIDYVKTLEPILFDNRELFRPPKDKVNSSIRDHNFLGRAKVMAALDKTDKTVGFAAKNNKLDPSPRSSPILKVKEFKKKLLNSAKPDIVAERSKPHPDPVPKSRTLPPKQPLQSLEPEAPVQGSVPAPAARSRSKSPLAPPRTSSKFGSDFKERDADKRVQPKNTQTTMTPPPPHPPPRNFPPVSRGSAEGSALPTKPALPPSLPSREKRSPLLPRPQLPQKKDLSKSFSPTAPPPCAEPPMLTIEIEFICNESKTLKLRHCSSLNKLVVKACELFELENNSIELWQKKLEKFTKLTDDEALEKLCKSKANKFTLYCFERE